MKFEDKDARLKDFADCWIETYGKGNLDLVLKNKELISYLNEGGFFTAPASTKYHGAYEGGLYEHSRGVFLRLKELTENMGLKWQREESPFIIGMFHDLCKCDQYVEKHAGPIELGLDYETPVYEHNQNTLLKGHGDKSVMILSRFLVLTEEEILCIRYHMGAYQKEDWDGFDLAIKKYQNVFWAHAADMVVSKVDGV